MHHNKRCWRWTCADGSISNRGISVRKEVDNIKKQPWQTTRRAGKKRVHEHQKWVWIQKSPGKGVLDIACLYCWRMKWVPLKVILGPANNEHWYVWLKVGSITQIAQWSAGTRQAHELTCCRWLTTKYGDKTHRRRMSMPRNELPKWYTPSLASPLYNR